MTKQTKKEQATKKHLSAPDLKLLLLLIVLSLAGTLMIFSASTAYAQTRFGDAYYFVKRQTLWLTLGIVTMLAVSRIPALHFSKYALPIFICSLVLLALVPLLGSEAGGARRWLALGPFTFQPSEPSQLMQRASFTLPPIPSRKVTYPLPSRIRKQPTQP